MSMIWWFVPWFPDDPALARLGQHCRFTNNEEMVRARSGAQTFSPINFPTARLELTLEKFSLDCFFWQSYILVSQDLRDAMAQEPWAVQYFPVDASLSAPLPRSKNYMIMRVPVVENVSDLDKSDYEYMNVVGLEGVLSPKRIAIRRDFQPKHGMSRDRFFSNYVFCTDECAVRILQRQCSGMRFIDPAYMDKTLRFRSLRGIEEESQDPEQGETHTRLIQPIQ
jgi:hypothetical protein